MPRSRQDVISEMVDSGLFTDDEIRSSVKGNSDKSSLAEKASATVKDLASIGGNGLTALATGMAQSGRPPMSLNELKALASPAPGTSYGILKTLQNAGENVTGAANSAVQNLPPLVQKAYAMRPGDLTPSSAAAQIGSGALAEGVTTLLAPLAKTVLSPLGRGIANTLERTSGLTYKTPGVLREAFADSGLQSAPGIAEVRPAYKAAKAAAGSIDGLVGSESSPILTPHMDIINKSLELAKEGKLSPAAAQTARMSLDAVKDSFPDEAVKNMRSFFDKTVKSSEGLAAADKAFSRAIKADALREAFPVNKGGGTSIMKLVTGVGATKFLGPAGIAADAALLSPAVQGAMATGAGIASRNLPAPLLTLLTSKALREASQRRKSNAAQ